MKKVLVVMHSLYNGGAERSLVNMLCELPADNYDIDLLLFERKGMFLEQVPEYVNILDTPVDIASLYDNSLCSIEKKCWKLAVNFISKILTKGDRERRAYRWKHFYGPSVKTIYKDYDVALAYIGGEVFYFLDEKVSAAKKVVWIHNDYRTANHPKKYDYDHLKNMDKIISISDRCVEILDEEFPEFADKTQMIENITSSSLIRKRAEEFVPTEYEKDKMVILSIGRLSEQKGFDIAIDAAKILKDKNYKFKWYIIGSGELEERLNAQIAKNGLIDSFVLLGARENPYPYIKNADIFVQPSRYEGKSVVLDETKIIGTPILASNYPTVGDQLVKDKEGLIVELNPDSLAEGVARMIDDSSVRESIHQYLLSNEYGNQDEIKKYIDLLG